MPCGSRHMPEPFCRRSTPEKCNTLRAKLHYTDTGYDHRLRTPPTDKLTTNSTTNLPHRNARAQHLDMSRCWDVANFCPLVVFVAGVRVVEFGSYAASVALMAFALLDIPANISLNLGIVCQKSRMPYGLTIASVSYTVC